MSSFMKKYLVPNDDKVTDVTHLSLMGHKLKFDFDLEDYQRDFLSPYLFHITTKKDHHMSLCERNLAHPSGYNFYVDIDIKTSKVPLKTVQDVFRHIRYQVVKYVCLKELSKDGVSYKDHAKIATEVCRGGKTHEEALGIVCKGSDLLSVNNTYERSTKLYDAVTVTAKKNDPCKFHIHFCGLVVDNTGAKDILQNVIRTHAFKTKFGEDVYSAVDTVSTLDHQLRMLGSRKGPRDQSFYQVCQLDKNGNMVPDVSPFAKGFRLMSITLGHLESCSLFPFGETLFKYKLDTSLNFIKYSKRTFEPLKRRAPAKRRRVDWNRVIDSADEDEF